MSHLKLLVAPASFLLSTAAFMVAIQQPPRQRLSYAPIVFGCSIWSLHACSYFAWASGVDSLWGLLNCYWMLHAMNTLYLAPVIIPPECPSWKSAYRIWADPQRRVDLKKPPPPPSNRAWFAIRRISKALLCWSLHLCLIAPIIMIYFDFTPEDFAPSRQVLLRRLLFPNTGPPFTIREIQIRSTWSLYWVWNVYLMLDTCHVLLSIIFVAMLRLDAPQEWPSLFGSPTQAYSLRRFWGRFWHRITVPFSLNSGRLITRRWLRISTGSRLEKVAVALWTFFLSAVAHSLTDWFSGAPCNPLSELHFYLVNFAAAAIESLAVPYLDQALLRSGKSRLRRILWSSPVRIIGGFSWVFCVFFWVAPKVQYSKLLDLVENT